MTDKDDSNTPAEPAVTTPAAPSENATSNPSPRPDQGLYFTKNTPMKDVETR